MSLQSLEDFKNEAIEIKNKILDFKNRNSNLIKLYICDVKEIIESLKKSK